MTPEEMQRSIEFLVDHHAKFAVEMDQIRYAQLKFQLQLGTLGEAVIAVTGMVGRVMEGQIRTDAKVAELVAAQLKTDEELGELAKRMDAFILVVERYISENQNGRNQ
ncbi:MAG: hypothetical protein AABO41_17350 [Acidobacteriota bacterium]